MGTKHTYEHHNVGWSGRTVVDFDTCEPVRLKLSEDVGRELNKFSSRTVRVTIEAIASLVWANGRNAETAKLVAELAAEVEHLKGQK